MPAKVQWGLPLPAKEEVQGAWPMPAKVQGGPAAACKRRGVGVPAHHQRVMVVRLLTAEDEACLQKKKMMIHHGLELKRVGQQLGDAAFRHSVAVCGTVSQHWALPLHAVVQECMQRGMLRLCICLLMMLACMKRGIPHEAMPLPAVVQACMQMGMLYGALPLPAGVQECMQRGMLHGALPLPAVVQECMQSGMLGLCFAC